MNRTGRPTGRPRGGTNHDPKIREKLLKLFQQGLGQTRVAHITGMSHGYVGNWWTIYLAHGKEALLEPMKQHKYSYETRLAAAKAVVDDKKDVVRRVCNFLWAARSRLIDVGGDSVTK